MKEGFDSKKYLDNQKEAFNKSLDTEPNKPAFLEFGGKPFSDHHAERVLPGYDAECKAEILRETVKLAEIVMVVNTLDILAKPSGRKPRGRIRGDSGLFYEQETLKILNDAHDRKIPISKVVMAVTPVDITNDDKDKIEKFRFDLKEIGVELLTHFRIDEYPSENILKGDKNPFKNNERVRTEKSNLVVVSPGGGSGKFGVLLSEMYHALIDGEIPKYVKFETFPIYQVDVKHALNLAFEAETADLGNKVISVKQKSADVGHRTSYDKDIENFQLLTELFKTFGQSEHIEHMKDAVDMGINKIVDGITDVDKIIIACREEINRRILRYEKEVRDGIEEMETVEIAREVLGKFDKMYEIKIDK